MTTALFGEAMPVGTGVVLSCWSPATAGGVMRVLDCRFFVEVVGAFFFFEVGITVSDKKMSGYKFSHAGHSYCFNESATAFAFSLSVVLYALQISMPALIRTSAAAMTTGATPMGWMPAGVFLSASSIKSFAV